MFRKLSLLVLASLMLFGAACWANTGLTVGKPIANLIYFVPSWTFAVGDEYEVAVLTDNEQGKSFSLCKIPPGSATPSCTPNWGTIPANGMFTTTGTFTSADIGTWEWYVTLPDGTVSSTSFFVVYALPGDTSANPPSPPPAQILVAANGFPADTLASLNTWLGWLDQVFPIVSYSFLVSRKVNVSPSTNGYGNTGAPNDILFPPTITGLKTDGAKGSSYGQECGEVFHTREFPYFFFSRMEESWDLAICEKAYVLLATEYPQAFGVSPLVFPGTGTSVPGTDGKELDTIGDRKTAVYGGASNINDNINTRGADEDASALLDVISERLHTPSDAMSSFRLMQQAIDLGLYADQGDQPGNLDGLATALGVTNVEGVKPSVLFRRNPVNFGLTPNGITYLGVRELWMDQKLGVGANIGSTYELDLVQFVNGIDEFGQPSTGVPVYQAGTVDWAISDSSKRVIVSGSTAIPATDSGYVFFSSYPQLFANGKFLLSEGAYHFTAVLEDASGHPSTDPNLFSEDVFAVVDPSRTLNPGDLVVVANGEGGKFGNLGSCNDLSFVAPQGASISGSSGLCFVTNVPKRTAGGFEDVTLRGYGFTRTAVPSSTAPRVVHMKNLNQPALVQGATDLTGKTVTSLVPGSIVIFSGWGFTANDASTATPRRPLPGTPHRSPSEMAMAMPPRQTPAPLTEGCTGTDLSDQGRSEVWFSQNGTVAKATILACADNQIEVAVPAGLASGANVAISVVVNGTPGLNALSLPVTAK